MTRGRKKNLTIPPSRALALQRDYRARKARYVQQLEDRCKAAEDENLRLKKELELARAGLSSMFSPHTVEAASELLKQLSKASACLLQFQQLAFPDIPSADMLGTLRPASFPSLAPSSQALCSTPSSSGSSNHYHIPNDNSRSQSFADGTTNKAITIGEPPFSRDSMSPSLGSECCGGFVDCTDLDEQEQDDLQENGLGPVPASTSGMRSTSIGSIT